MTDERAQQPDLDAEWEEIARFLAGESTPEEQRRLRARLARDPERAALVQALDAALTPPEEEPLSADEVERALASVMARRGSTERRSASAPDVVPLQGRPTARIAAMRSRWRGSALRAAAAVLVVAGASLVWRASRNADHGATATARTSDVEYASATGHVDTLRLSDGTTVLLGPSSRLRVAHDYGARARELTLDGQAFFDVVHDDARPFIVHTTSATLRDVGTSFIVRSDGDRGTRVAVTSGAVDVVAARAGGEPTVLHAGDRAEVMGDRMTVERGAVKGDELAWTQGTLIFRDAPMTTVAAELRRWYGIRLVIDDSALAGRRLTATFERGNADDVGRVLAAVLGGSVSRTGDTLRIGARSPGR